MYRLDSYLNQPNNLPPCSGTAPFTPPWRGPRGLLGEVNNSAGSKSASKSDDHITSTSCGSQVVRRKCWNIQKQQRKRENSHVGPREVVRQDSARLPVGRTLEKFGLQDGLGVVSTETLPTQKHVASSCEGLPVMVACTLQVDIHWMALWPSIKPTRVRLSVRHQINIIKARGRSVDI